MTNARKPVVELAVALVGIFVAMYGLVLFNRHLLMSFSLHSRMVLMIVTQWFLVLVPGLLMLTRKDNIRDIGFRKVRVPKQIILGVLAALGLSLVLTVLPILLGFRDLVGSTSYTEAWQFIYTFFYMIVGVALAEEIVFRGYIFHKLLEIRDCRWFAIIISSVIFGISHAFSGDVLQVFMTAGLGVIFCLFREKIEDYTTLSLIITHGVYNGLIQLFVAVL